MAITNKLFTLLDTLRGRTDQGAVKWTSGSREDTYLWSGSAASVALSTKDNDSQAPWLIRLIDSDGRVMESEMVDGASPFFEMVGDLYSGARSSALNIDGTIDGLLDDLGPF